MEENKDDIKYKELLEVVSKLNEELAALKDKVEHLIVDYVLLETKVDLMQE